MGGFLVCGELLALSMLEYSGKGEDTGVGVLLWCKGSDPDDGEFGSQRGGDDSVDEGGGWAV